MTAFRIAVLLLALTASAAAQTPRPMVDITGLPEKLRPSVVTIETKIIEPPPPAPAGLERFLDGVRREGRERDESATGIVFDARQGLIVTSDYVLEADEPIDVVLADGRAREGRIVGVDKHSGVGLLRVDPSGLVDVAWADRAPRAGEPIFLLGNAYQLGVIASAGIVAASDVVLDEGPAEVFLMDLLVHSGSAGGPVADRDGSILGMAAARFGTAYDVRQAVGIAIPAAEVRRIGALLARDGKIERGRIGVTLQVEFPRGVTVTEVIAGASAQRAGLRVGDIIKTAAGQPLADDRQLARLIARQPIGASIPLTIERDGQRAELAVTVEPAN
jgi:S1-C subfamily serine protease